MTNPIDALRGQPASPRQRAMVQLMQAAGRVERALEEVCAAHGLTHDQYNVLRILRGAHPHGHPRYEIADRLINRAPDVTRLVGRLVRAGLVERYRPEQDQRLSMARVTDAGLRLLAEVDPEIREVHESLAADLNAEEVRALGSLCNAVQGAQRDGEAE